MELELSSRVKQISTIKTLGRRSSKSQTRGIQILFREKPRILAKFQETPIITERTADKRVIVERSALMNNSITKSLPV